MLHMQDISWRSVQIVSCRVPYNAGIDRKCKTCARNDIKGLQIENVYSVGEVGP